MAHSIVDTLSEVVEQAAVTIVITDGDGVIEYVNPAFESLTGYSREMALGRTPRLLRSGVQSPEFYEQLWRSLRAGRTFQATFTNKRRDGVLYDHEQTITPVRQRGEITHFISTGCDVTARQRSARARQQDETMRVASLLYDEVGQFLALAHMTLADVSRSLPLDTSNRLHEARRYLDQVEERLREVARGVQPRLVADLGLVESIRFLAKGCERRLGVPVTVAAQADLQCPGSIETLLYRVTQDTLHIIAQRSDVTAVGVSITPAIGGRRQSDATLRCAITVATTSIEPGEGVPTPDRRFASIARQVEAVGGTLQVLGVAGGGMQVLALLPLSQT